MPLSTCNLLSFLANDILVLTANRRITNRLQQDLANEQARKNTLAFPTPKIFPFNTWLIDFYINHHPQPKRILSEIASDLLWRDIINQMPHPDWILPSYQTAKLAKSANNTLRLWGVNPSSIDITNDEIALFVTWAKLFNERCESLNATIPADLATTLIDLLDKEKVWPKQIHLVGFTEIPPTQRHLLDALQKKTEIIWQAPEKITEPVSRITLNTLEDEIHNMARWAKAQNTNKRIACIIPKLSQIQSTVMRIFIEVFCPDRILPGSQQDDLPFNMSAGHALSDFDIVKTALTIINLNLNHLNQKTIAQILLSPYINHDTLNRSFGALVETKCRKLKSKIYPKEKITAILNEFQHLFSESDLTTRWLRFAEIHPPQKALPSCWIYFFQTRLNAMGFPGQKILSSLEYQVSTRWQQALYEFAELDFITGEINLFQATDVLNQLLHSIIFQPQNKPTNIHVMGLLEAVGSEFDAAWILGLDDEAWPPMANPNPFLPVDLQRKMQMPHASADRELIYSQQIQENILACNKKVIFSYAQNNQDKQLQVSRLIAPFPEITTKEIELAEHSDLMLTVFKNKKIDYFVDHQAKSIQADEHIQGGTRILEKQALCPFRAFASLRLNAESLDEPYIGMNAADRGTLLHNVLAFIWKEIKTQKALLNYSKEKRDELIYRAIENECHHQTNLFYAVEKERLYKIMDEWLSLEEKRPAFTVSECESQHTFTIGHLNIKCRIDRIDTLENNAKIIIDYKTGNQNKISHWEGSRPEQPQLPLYCAYSDESLGLCYAQVKRGEMKFIGWAADEDVQHYFPALKNKQENEPNWSQQIQEWKKTLTTLSDEFYRGVATVDPLHQLVCQYCELASLCRVKNNFASEAVAKQSFIGSAP